MVKNESVFLDAERSQARSNHIIIRGLIIAARDTIRIVNEALYVERSVMAYRASLSAKKKDLQTRSILQPYLPSTQHLSHDVVFPELFDVISTRRNHIHNLLLGVP